MNKWPGIMNYEDVCKIIQSKGLAGEQAEILRRAWEKLVFYC